MEAANETKFGARVAWGWGWCPNVVYTHSAEKGRDTTLDDENASQHVDDKKCDVPYTRRRQNIENRTSNLVTALCNPKLSLRILVTTRHVTCD